jgi:hypothetical protein
MAEKSGDERGKGMMPGNGVAPAGAEPAGLHLNTFRGIEISFVLPMVVVLR